jgi:hypothetical protein
MKKYTEAQIRFVLDKRELGELYRDIAEDFNNKFKTKYAEETMRNIFRRNREDKGDVKVKVLVLDIETCPIQGYVWGLFDQNVALSQIVEDWSILSWSAKWIGSDKVMYADTRNEKNVRNDKKMLKGIWDLLDQADVVIGQNSTRFDIKKLNARFILNGMKPPSSFRQIDTMRLAKRYFSFTSNKLEYLSKNLCPTVEKSDHKKFPGFALWSECLKKNKEAFEEMEAYNITDILATEELYHRLKAWDKSINFNVYHSGLVNTCTCGSSKFFKNGYVFTNSAKFQRYTCSKCGAESVDKENILIKDKKKSLRK